MKLFRSLLPVTAVIGLAVAGTGFTGQALAGPVTVAAVRPAPASSSGFRAACPSARTGYQQCFAIYRPQTAVNRAIAAGASGRVSRPIGLTPKAYRLPVSRLSDQTVAVSIAYNTPHLADYLAKYRQTFGLPSCTVASGCFRVVNEYGNASPGRLPGSGVMSGWDLEVTLDVSMISVACPHCKIIVVEGKNPRKPGPHRRHRRRDGRRGHQQQLRLQGKRLRDGVGQVV
jgi:hypothetical protein